VSRHAVGYAPGVPKGIYTQAACVLFDRAPTIDDVERALGPLVTDKARRTPAADGADGWLLGGPGVLVSCGAFDVLVDVVDHVWPDDMGHPERAPTVFMAWSTGQLGPFTYPGNLERARLQAWMAPTARERSAQARAFVRIRASWCLGRGQDAPVMPAGYSALTEIERITELGRAVLAVPGALAWFVPGGEVLLGAPELDAVLTRRREGGPPPVDAWVNVRLFDLPDEATTVQDTVGAPQLDVDDVEAVYAQRTEDPAHVHAFLLDLLLYRMERGAGVIQPGHTVKGPDGSDWRTEQHDQSFGVPPRPVLRFLPPGFSGPEVDVEADAEPSA